MGRGSTELEEMEHIRVLISQGGKHKTIYIRKKFLINASLKWLMPSGADAHLKEDSPHSLIKKGQNTLLKRFKPKDSSKNSAIRTEQLLHFF